MPIGPTGRMNAIGRPACRASWISRAISWPMKVSKSANEAQATGSNCGCHHFCRAVACSGGTAARRSIFARSQPGGKEAFHHASRRASSSGSCEGFLSWSAAARRRFGSFLGWRRLLSKKASEAAESGSPKIQSGVEPPHSKGAEQLGARLPYAQERAPRSRGQLIFPSFPCNPH